MLTDSRIIVLPKANLKDLLNKNADLFSFDLTTIAHRKPVKTRAASRRLHLVN
jgi:hypothetical protein